MSNIFTYTLSRRIWTMMRSQRNSHRSTNRIKYRTTDAVFVYMMHISFVHKSGVPYAFINIKDLMRYVSKTGYILHNYLVNSKVMHVESARKDH